MLTVARLTQSFTEDLIEVIEVILRAGHPGRLEAISLDMDELVSHGMRLSLRVMALHLESVNENP
ncbi:hypothetical protein [Thioclava sp.]|uniref:hypothetical protein n=1 Tax=Thioclava sp. TaxID=1933450 RepID=UPI003AA7DEEC